ncbi:MAG: hypothetical protein ACKON9_08970, partial [Planctomycetaceae bacterium]
GERYWMERLGGNFSASPVYANGHILLLDENGHATWIKPARCFFSRLRGREHCTVLRRRTLAEMHVAEQHAAARREPRSPEVAKWLSVDATELPCDWPAIPCEPRP